MLMEVRPLASADDVLAVQIECKRRCSGFVTLPLDDPQNPIPEHLTCPICGNDFWNPAGPSHEYSFVEAVAGLRHRLPLRRFKGDQPNIPNPTRVRLVLPCESN